MSDRDNSNSFLWFLAGLGFGALMGVLYAPRSGRETREAIKNYVRTADAKYAHIVPIKNSKITLTSAEVEAFRTDYQGEKSFRADYVNIMMRYYRRNYQ